MFESFEWPFRLLMFFWVLFTRFGVISAHAWGWGFEGFSNVVRGLGFTFMASAGLYVLGGSGKCCYCPCVRGGGGLVRQSACRFWRGLEKGVFDLMPRSAMVR